MLADATRLGVIRHGRPEAWAAGAVAAVARVNGVFGAGRTLTAEQVAAELDVTLGTLAVAVRRRPKARAPGGPRPRAGGDYVAPDGVVRRPLLPRQRSVDPARHGPIPPK